MTDRTRLLHAALVLLIIGMTLLALLIWRFA
jgi:hypothetical protein